MADPDSEVAEGPVQQINLTFLDDNCKNKIISAEDGLWLQWIDPTFYGRGEFNTGGWIKLEGASIDENGILSLTPCTNPHDTNCFEEPIGPLPPCCIDYDECLIDPSTCQILDVLNHYCWRECERDYQEDSQARFGVLSTSR